MLTHPLTVTSSEQAVLDQALRTNVWRGSELAVSRATTMPTGHAVLDLELHNGDLAARANLDAGDMTALASANALESLSGNRRQAVWQAKTSVPDKGPLRPAEIIEELVELECPTDAENVSADYSYVGLTLGRHPVSFLRERLSKMRFILSDVLAGFSNGQLARRCGIVTVRQRPGTAKGVVFITLEDEAGAVNVICWPNLVEQFRREVLGAQLLAYTVYDSVRAMLGTW